MKEDFLHYIWSYHLRLNIKYLTDDGKEFVVLDKGRINSDAGPDIACAQVSINGIKWVGNVEFHVKASEWYVHKHDKDSAYDNVILHFVAYADKTVKTISGRVLDNAVFPKLQSYYDIFEYTFNKKQFVYCDQYIEEVSDIVIKIWLRRLLVERLEEKTERVLQLIDNNKGHWEDALYQLLAHYLGQRLNGDAFENLARKLPQTLLAKHKNSLLQIEALFFGQAGMLGNSKKDNYYLKLQKEYSFLKNKYDLKPMDLHEWKFLRLRPANFPTLRIAQLAMITHRSQKLFSKIIAIKSAKEIKKLFAVGTSQYWDTHYTFGKESSVKRKKMIGDSIQDVLIINAIVPLLFAYAKYMGKEDLQEKAIRLLKEISPEKNHITTGWENIDLLSKNAGETQSLIQLKNRYCDFKKCESCAIGYKILEKRYK